MPASGVRGTAAAASLANGNCASSAPVDGCPAAVPLQEQCTSGLGGSLDSLDSLALDDADASVPARLCRLSMLPACFLSSNLMKMTCIEIQTRFRRSRGVGNLELVSWVFSLHPTQRRGERRALAKEGAATPLPPTTRGVFISLDSFQFGTHGEPKHTCRPVTRYCTQDPGPRTRTQAPSDEDRRPHKRER